MIMDQLLRQDLLFGPNFSGIPRYASIGAPPSSRELQAALVRKTLFVVPIIVAERSFFLIG